MQREIRLGLIEYLKDITLQGLSLCNHPLSTESNRDERDASRLPKKYYLESSLLASCQMSGLILHNCSIQYSRQQRHRQRRVVEFRGHSRLDCQLYLVPYVPHTPM